MNLSIYTIAIFLFTIFKLASAWSNVLLTGNELNKDLIICDNDDFHVYLEGYPETGYSWVLENFDDLKDYGITPEDMNVEAPSVKLIQSNSTGSVFEFNFEFTNTTLEELPSLKFLYKNDSNSGEGKDDNERRAQVNLLMDKDKKKCGRIRKTIDYYENNNKEEFLNVESGKLYQIKLKGEQFTDSTLSSGHSWYLEYKDEIKSNGLIEILCENSEILREKKDENIISIYEYLFEVKEFSDESVLPVLVFSFKETPESKDAKAMKIVNLRDRNEIYIEFEDGEKNSNLEKSYNIRRSEVFNVELNVHYPFVWYLENIKEILKLGSLELLNLDENGTVPFIPKGILGSSGIPGKYHFKFQFNKNAETGYLKHPLVFTKVRSLTSDAYYDNATLNVFLKKDRNEEDLYDRSLPVFRGSGGEIYVESNSILEIPLSSNPSTGYYWYFINENEIDRSEVIDYIGDGYSSSCYATGCGGTHTFHFRIWEVSNEDEFPIINLVYKRSFERGFTVETIGNDLKIKLRLKSSTTECSFDGYKCCSNTDTKIRYQDDDGDWGVENGEWCFFKKEEEEEEEKKEENPKLIRTCTSEAYGYPCCKSQHEYVYTDDDGKWSIENGNWCGVYTCVYTGDYPVCKNTTKEIYVDEYSWGKEDHKWCIICK